MINIIGLEDFISYPAGNLTNGTGLEILFSYPVENWWIFVLGYSYSIFLSHIPIRDSLEILRQHSSHSLMKKNNFINRSDMTTAAVIGYMERAVYTTFLLISSPQFNSLQFIGLWIGLKVASQWNNIWSRANQLKGDSSNILQKYIVYGEDVYNTYLIGCALSLIYSVIGATIILKCLSGEYLFLTIALFSLLLPYILWKSAFYVTFQSKHASDSQISSEATVGELVYTVNNVQVANILGDILGDEYANIKAKGIFVIIDIMIKNSGSKSTKIDADYMKIVDFEGREVKIDSQAQEYIHPNLLHKQIPHNQSIKGQLAFDVPNEIACYLQVTDNINQINTKLIALKLKSMYTSSCVTDLTEA